MFNQYAKTKSLLDVDGRQARRTGTSSALGHIFDHTIDSLNCVLGSVMQTVSLCVLTPSKAVFLILLACSAMWFVSCSLRVSFHSAERGIEYVGRYTVSSTEIPIILLICTILQNITPAHFSLGISMVLLRVF